MSTNHHLRHTQQRLRRIAAEWPADPLRPNLQLKTFFAALADHPALSARAVAATRALHKNRVSDRVSSRFYCFSRFSRGFCEPPPLSLKNFPDPHSTDGVEAHVDADALRSTEGGLREDPQRYRATLVENFLRCMVADQIKGCHIAAQQRPSFG